MKVLLINPRSPYLENAAAYPPMGLLYVAAALEREGCKVSLVDLALGKKPYAYALRKMIPHDTDLIGLTCVTPNVNAVKAIVNLMPKGIPTMVGGIHPTIYPQETHDYTGCTTVIQGEADCIMRDVVNDLKTGFLNPVYKANPPQVSDISKPARHLVNLHAYTPGGERATTIYTSRGCPFSCMFCSKIPNGMYREFPVSRVIEEVRDVMALGFKKVVFGDDNLGVNKRRLLDLLGELEPLDIAFRLNMDSRKPNRAVFEKAARAGCTDISFGIESGSIHMLHSMNKQVSIAENEESVYLTQEYGMKAKAYFMVNFPGETEDTVKETLAFAERVKPDNWLLSSFAPLPGSFVYNNPALFGITSMSRNWNDYYLVGKNGSFSPCYTTKHLSYKKQIELHDMMYNGLKEILG